MNGYCCRNEPIVKAEYDGGVKGNDFVFVCRYHLNRHPWNRFIISKEFVKNKKIEFSPENSDKNNRPVKEGALN